MGLIKSQRSESASDRHAQDFVRSWLVQPFYDAAGLQARKAGNRILASSDNWLQSVHDLALAMYDEGVFGPGWVWISNVIQKDEVAKGFSAAGGADGGNATSRSGRSEDVWKVLQHIVQVLHRSDSARVGWLASDACCTTGGLPRSKRLPLLEAVSRADGAVSE